VNLYEYHVSDAYVNLVNVILKVLMKTSTQPEFVTFHLKN
jgi:hypothetical protein